MSAQTIITVPVAYDQVDAPSHLWVAGMSRSLRQQTIIDASHLQALVGRTLTAISFRRSAANEVFTGAAADFTVRLATSTGFDSHSASDLFAQNLGAWPAVVFSGIATAPTSPVAAGPNVPWSPEHTIRVAFQTPFQYSGGTLVVDVVGLARPGQSSPWWVADCAYDTASGTAISVGTACGTHANAQGQWASASRGSLLPGATGILSADGSPNGLALLVLGAPAMAPGLPLHLLLPGARPTCEIFVPQPFDMLFTAFSGPIVPADTTGTAIITISIPDQPWALGASFGSQWMDLADQFAVSNAVNCTISTTMPSLGMAHIRGEALSPDGQVSTNQAHVVRFEAQ